MSVAGLSPLGFGPWLCLRAPLITSAGPLLTAGPRLRARAGAFRPNYDMAGARWLSAVMGLRANVRK